MIRYTDTAVISHLALAFRFSLGIVFLLSAVPKMRRPSAFAQRVVAYEVLPARFAMIFALALIPAEAFLAFAFLIGWAVNVALLLAVATLLTFLLAVEVNLLRNRRISCGCFGGESEQISPRTLGRLVLLLSVALLLCILNFSGYISWPSSTPMMVGSALPYLLEMTCLAISLILLGSWLLNLPELMSLIRYLLRGHQSPRNLGRANTAGGA